MSQSMKNSSASFPGPGAYSGSYDCLRANVPSFGFGTSKRPDYGNTRMNVPGPGAYKLPAKVSQVPEYALPTKSEQSKYV